MQLLAKWVVRPKWGISKVNVLSWRLWFWPFFFTKMPLSKRLPPESKAEAAGSPRLPFPKQPTREKGCPEEKRTARPPVFPRGKEAMLPRGVLSAPLLTTCPEKRVGGMAGIWGVGGYRQGEQCRGAGAGARALSGRVQTWREGT